MEEQLISARVDGIVGDLPALPAVVAEVLRLTEDPNTSTVDVSEVIQSDPAMTAKVLRISNSSYYGMKQYVGTLKLALVILGVREVRNIVLGISVFETASESGSDIKVAQDIWNQSLKTAGICKKLSAVMGLGLQGEEFIAGLLADIGIMGLLRSDDATYKALFSSLGQDQLALRKAEKLHYGFTHAAVSMAMTQRWNLPQTLSDAVGMQYPAEGLALEEAKDPKLTALVRIAKGIDHSREGEHRIARVLEDDAAWAILAESRKPIAVEDRKPLLLEFLEELNAVAALPL
ncbi:MAG: HDOD domain-containing protein [Candidatus Hydrogenedentes bacterium]|nr:HDOD domain-containing protein [Candidatus Hydrogenedentota bacterium]